MKPLLLVVDDDEEIRTQMRWALASEYDLKLVGDRVEALNAFQSLQPMVVLLDLGLPPHPGDTTEGMAALTAIRSADPLAKVIVVSGQSEKNKAMDAVASGAYDFICKPVDLEELQVVLKRAFYVAALEREHVRLQQVRVEQGFEEMLGASLPMQQVFAAIQKVAATTAPVLLLGESGTGKEMAARAIHNKSPRKSAPFVAINCGAIPGSLLESELFGHERGAFTGAHMQRKGRIETANGGTLFLDEIGEIPPELQVKLLRFIQEQCIERVGGRESIPVDTRLVAATNANLVKAIKENRFREDLYYRLAVIVIKLPALRDRDGDAQFLAKQFLKKFALENGKPGLAFDPEALKAIFQHRWPGNVRELENRVKRAVIMSDSQWIRSKDLELESITAKPQTYNLKQAREELERELVTTVLRKHSGRITAAASELGISRPTLYELMEKLGISER